MRGLAAGKRTIRIETAEVRPVLKLPRSTGVGSAGAVSNTTVPNLSGFGDPLQGIQNEVARQLR